MTGCGPDALYPVVRATPSVTILPPGPVKAGRLVTMRYSWRVDEQFKPPPSGHRVFVHFLGPDKRLAFTDDHNPSPPIAEWRAGAIYAYERTVILPDDLSELIVRVGLFSAGFPYKARVLDSVHAKPGFPIVGSIRIAENLGRIEEGVAGETGFYSWNQDARATARSWRWTRNRATFVFLQRPEGVALLLQGYTERERLSKDPTLSLRVGSVEAKRVLTNRDRVVIRLDISGDAKPAIRQGSLEMDDSFLDFGRELAFCVELFRAVPLAELGQLSGNYSQPAFSSIPQPLLRPPASVESHFLPRASYSSLGNGGFDGS